MNRRGFLKTAAIVGAGAMTGWRPGRALGQSAATAEIILSPGQAQTVISPQIYGHFIEHLGGVIYDGIWVGRDSKIANVDGIRKQFIDDMKAIGAPNLRWPGGCFADGYHWRDGIGPPEKRPRTYNFWQERMPAMTKGVEVNQFGTHEFMKLCRLVGAVPYVAGNVGGGTVQEFHDWISYCNAPVGSLSLADERAANGDKEPFNVKYWGVGNESWGCGGDMHPAEYATLYRKYSTQFPMFTKPFLVAAGPRGHQKDRDRSWTSGFFDAMQGGRRTPVDGFAVHYYTDWRNTSFRAADFSAKQWYSVLQKGAAIESVLLDHWNIMSKYDMAKRTKFVIDEWGNWYPPGEELTPEFLLYQPMTLRDALHTAITFDIFNRDADKIEMANVAQTINCLHSLFLAHEDKYVRTPVYYVFQMYQPHMNGKLVPLKISGGEQTVAAEEGEIKIPVVSGSASVTDRILTLTLSNPSLEAPVNAVVRINDARATEAKAVVLTHEDRRAANTFADANNVKLATLAATVDGSTVRVNIPKQSVAAISIRLT